MLLSYYITRKIKLSL